MNLTLKEQYDQQVAPQMMAKFGYKNKLAVPRLLKVTINIGIPSAKKEDNYLKLLERTITKISGQKPVFTKAKKAISAFKTRKGQIVGVKVDLRKNKMYDFLFKLINVVLPRVRDFRGLQTTSVDRQGNLSLGFKEHLVFGEIDQDEVDSVHGLQIVINTNAQNKEKGLELFKLLGFPFQKS